jgi:hypothetical protein
MADHIVNKVSDFFLELWRLRFKLGERVRQSMRDLDVLAAQFAEVSYRDCRTQSAVPACAIAITSRRVSGIFGPRSTKSPTKMAMRPSGGVTLKLLPLCSTE